MNVESRENMLLALKFKKIKSTFNKFKEMNSRINDTSLSSGVKEVVDKEPAKRDIDWPNFHYALGLLTAFLKIKQKRTKARALEQIR